MISHINCFCLDIYLLIAVCFGVALGWVHGSVNSSSLTIIQNRKHLIILFSFLSHTYILSNKLRLITPMRQSVLFELVST